MRASGLGGQPDGSRQGYVLARALVLLSPLVVYDITNLVHYFTKRGVHYLTLVASVASGVLGRTLLNSEFEASQAGFFEFNRMGVSLWLSYGGPKRLSPFHSVSPCYTLFLDGSLQGPH